MMTQRLGPRFDEALRHAGQLHATQVRKGTDIPYVSHLLGVCSIALEHGADEDEAIAALLHDAAEDQGGRACLDEIRRQFGSRVASIVEECTDTLDEPKPPWRLRKQAYIAAISHTSPSGRLVSASDKLHNARSILADYRRYGDALWTRFNAGSADQLWYYVSLVAAFQAAGDHEALIAELAVAVRTLRSEVAPALSPRPTGSSV
jgi:GTP pyrophosphokinase